MRCETIADCLAEHEADAAGCEGLTRQTTLAKPGSDNRKGSTPNRWIVHYFRHLIIFIDSLPILSLRFCPHWAIGDYSLVSLVVRSVRIVHAATFGSRYGWALFFRISCREISCRCENHSSGCSAALRARPLFKWSRPEPSSCSEQTARTKQN